MSDIGQREAERVCLIVPGGTFDATELAAALLAQRPGLDLGAVWAGDPHRRPASAAPGVRWWDLDLAEPHGIGWGRLLVASAPEAYEWARTGRAVARLLRDQDDPVVVLRVGSVGVAGPLDHLVPERGVTVAVRSSAPFDNDGLAPTNGDLVDRGRWSTAVLGCAPAAASALDALADVLSTSSLADRVGPLMELALHVGDLPIEAAERVAVVGWSTDRTPSPCVVDVDDLDRDEPWHVAFGGRRPRVLLSQDRGTADVLAATAGQWRGVRLPLSLPGGVDVDGTMRTLMNDAIAAWARGEADLPPEPFGGSGLLDWLASASQRSEWDLGRYWYEEWLRRPDLNVAFPEPLGADRSRFITWARQSWRSDGRSPLIEAEPDRATTTWRDVDHRPGINVVGYVSSDSGLGDFTRRVHAALEAAHVPVGALDYHRTASPTAADLPPLTTDVVYDTNLITVHADQMGHFAQDHGAQVFHDRTSIAYWFWELSHVPPRIVANVAMVDEIWAASGFIADAFRAVTDKPVDVVHVPVPEPRPSERTRPELGLREARFVFLVTLDHLSITDRKNPLGAIHAFERAFPAASDGGPLLMVKTLNGRQRWSEHEQLQLAAARRPDITVVDRHVSRADQMALIQHSDCLVSLHRSEGLGLHLMESMWLGTPVIATRYSGNLEFMSDDNSVLIDAGLIPVTDRQGYYPTDAVWADPDIDQAAEAMQRIVDDRDHRDHLVAAGRRTMMEQSSPAQAGQMMAGLCHRAGRQRERS